MSARKVKVSKNRKKSWKKHSNIDEIEEFLEDKRLDERIGKDESNSNTLFFIEKSGTKAEVKKKDSLKEKKKRKLLTTKDILKNLKTHKSLESKSAVKPFFNSKSCAPQISKKLRSKNLKKKVETSKEQSSKAKANRAAQLQGIDNPAFYDLWNESAPKVDDEITELESMQMQLIGKNKPKISEYRYQKPSLLPAIEIPHPGTSYNPSFEAHQDLLAKAHVVEATKVKQDAHLKRVLDDYIPKEYDADKQWMEEMTQGLNEENEEDNEDCSPDNNQLLVSTLKVPKRKLKAQRRREERQKLLQSKVNAQKDKNRKENQIYNLRKINKEIKEAEQKSERRKKMRDAKQIEKMFTPRILSKHKFEEPEIDLNLTEEISGSLRSVITEGDLLKDRFASLQKRNIIEPRVRILKHRKKHVKYFVKKHCRD